MKKTTPRPALSKAQRQAATRARRENIPSGPLPVQHPDAAGIDIAVNDDLWVAVGPHASERPVRSFSPRTAGQQALCAWLRECHVDTVAMEATGSYWLNLYLVLREAGLAVVVVNPRTVKALQRKSDVSDCQWLRYLHSVGLLRGSFIPAEEFLALRTLSRQRENLLSASSQHTLRLQKALDEMNLHLHHVIDDVMGTTGRAILEAILAGERDSHRLAALRHHRIQADEATVAESLQGRWTPELLLVLRQEYATWQHLQAQVQTCEELLLAGAEGLLATMARQNPPPAETAPETPSAAAGPAPAPAATPASQPKPKRPSRAKGKCGQVRKNGPAQGERWQLVLQRLLGVDLTLTPGVSLLTVIGLLCELGTDWSSFPTAGHFASWLGLCPEHRISGGKILSRATRTVQNRVRNLLKMGAQSLARSHGCLGQLYGRWRARLGPAKANTAMAHKLARLLWHQITHQSPYDETYLAQLDQAHDRRAKAKLIRTAAQLGYELVPLKEAA